MPPPPLLPHRDTPPDAWAVLLRTVTPTRLSAPMLKTAPPCAGGGSELGGGTAVAKPPWSVRFDTVSDAPPSPAGGGTGGVPPAAPRSPVPPLPAMVSPPPWAAIVGSPVGPWAVLFTAVSVIVAPAATVI